MPNSLVKLSTISNVDSSVIGASDIFYYVHQAPGGPVSNSLKLSDLFKGTNNLTSDIKFNNNTLYIKSGKVGINKIPSVALDVLGVGNISGSFTVGGTSTLNGAVTLGSSLSVGTSISSGGNISTSGSVIATANGTFGGGVTVTGNINTSGSVIASVNGIFGGTLTMSSRTVDAFPAGTCIVFAQTAAPTGWTKSVVYNDAALRVVSSTAGSGGTVGFSTAFSANNTVDGHAISIAEMPIHSHTATVTDPQHAHTVSAAFQSSQTAGVVDARGSSNQTLTTNSVSTGITVANANTGSGSTHVHTLSNLAIKYVDTIICYKN